MARIQVLPLPAKTLGAASYIPFVLIIDQVQSDEFVDDGGSVEAFAALCDTLARKTGAAMVMVVQSTLDVA